MAKMLTTWIEHQNQQNMPLFGMVIQEKVRSLYGDLTKDTNDPVPFAASHGWFECLKSCHAFHNLKSTGEAADAEKFPTVFKSVIADGGYTPRQVFLTSMKLDFIGNACPATLSSSSSSSPTTLAGGSD